MKVKKYFDTERNFLGRPFIGFLCRKFDYQVSPRKYLKYDLLFFTI